MQVSLVRLGALSQHINPLAVMLNNHHSTQPEVPRSNRSPNGSPLTLPPPSKSSKRRWRLRSSRGVNQPVSNGNSALQNGHDHKVAIADEKSDLLGEVVILGMLVPDGKKSKTKADNLEINATLTTKEFVWAAESLKLDDIVAISYKDGSRRFTIHSFAFKKTCWVPNPFAKACRKRKDRHFLAPSPEDALKWVSAFAAQRCYVNCSPHPLSSSKKQGSIIDARDSSPDLHFDSQPGRSMLVVLNPRSGRGCARSVYDKKVEPILKLAGFKLKVIETVGPQYAYKLAATMDLSSCTDGIICVGGDGIINEVLNGLLSRDDHKQSMGVPIGIIPAGSDNSLIWTVMGIQDPVSAALAIVKGDLVAMDVFAVEWINTGYLHMGLTVAYHGFMSDVLELSEKYQKRFGPLRYFVAGALKLLCLPSYNCEVEYLPVVDPSCADHGDSKRGHVEIPLDTANGDCFSRKSMLEKGVQPSHDLMIPSRISGDHDTGAGDVDPNVEPSEYVRGLDAKTKRAPCTRVSTQTGPEEVLAVHHPMSGPTTPSPRPRTRSKSRLDRGWANMGSGNRSARTSWDYSMIESTGEFQVVPGEDMTNSSGPKWDSYENFDVNTGSEAEVQASSKISGEVSDEFKWVVRQGPFLGVMICNHQCKTVQCLESQVLAPAAEHDDGTLDLVMVRGAGRFQLLRFFVLMQFGRHISLPFVEHTKVRSVKLKPGNGDHKGCGIDGELLTLNGTVSTYLLPKQCKLIGRSVQHS
eukprot:c29171_g1_i1 orf=1411-3663(+)